MKQTKKILVLAVLVSGALLSITGKANAASYNFSLDRFEVSGNLPVKKIDDFDNGTINPFWEIYEQTVVESGSTVTFSNPGVIDPPFQLGVLQITSEMSYIGSTSSGGLQMQNGSGDFQGTSTWTPTIPAPDQFYTMGIQNEEKGEDISIGVFNFSSAAASVFGLSPGLGISFGRYGDVGSGDFEVQNDSVMQVDIVGNIVLQIAFDDSKDE